MFTWVPTFIGRQRNSERISPEGKSPGPWLQVVGRTVAVRRAECAQLRERRTPKEDECRFNDTVSHLFSVSGLEGEMVFKRKTKNPSASMLEISTIQTLGLLMMKAENCARDARWGRDAEDEDQEVRR